MDFNMLVLSFRYRQIDLLPIFIRDLHRLFYKALASRSQGNELDVLRIYFIEDVIACQFRIKYQRFLYDSLYPSPVINKLPDFLRRLGPFNIRSGIYQRITFASLSKKRVGSFQGLPTSTAPNLFHLGFFSKVRDRVEIKIDGLALIQIRVELVKVFHYSLLEFHNNRGLSAAGVRAHIRRLRQHIQPGKNPESHIGVVLLYMAKPFIADQFQQ